MLAVPSVGDAPMDEVRAVAKPPALPCTADVLDDIHRAGIGAEVERVDTGLPIIGCGDARFACVELRENGERNRFACRCHGSALLWCLGALPVLKHRGAPLSYFRFFGFGPVF